ncbi:MAG: YbbR-like domain-containing protein, partial [Candidatus Aminicenantes bacterium]|nr:YbbR-like domain-containing protein [Candidatus Aminicenantes bacterium]
MALLLWFHVATEKVYEYTKSFPVKISNIPEELILSQEVPEEVQVKIQGKGKELLKLLLMEQKNLQIDIGDFRVGENNYSFKPEEIPIPQGLDLRVKEILSPQSIKINLDRLIESKVPIRSQITILPEDGYLQTGEVSLDSHEVVISGPRRLMRKIKSIQTEKKMLESVTEPISDQIALILPEGYNLELSFKQVGFSADIQKAIGKEIPSVPVETVNLPKGRKVEVQPDSINVVVLGGENVVNQLTKDQIKVTIDCARLKRNKETKIQPLVKL